MAEILALGHYEHRDNADLRAEVVLLCDDRPWPSGFPREERLRYAKWLDELHRRRTGKASGCLAEEPK